MKSTLRMVFTLSLLIACARMTGLAQTSTAAPSSSETGASDDSTPAVDKASTSSPAAATKPEGNPGVEQKIDLLQKQIDELQSELKAVRASALVDADSSALKTAEKTLVTGSGTA